MSRKRIKKQKKVTNNPKHKKEKKKIFSAAYTAAKKKLEPLGSHCSNLKSKLKRAEKKPYVYGYTSAELTEQLEMDQQLAAAIAVELEKALNRVAQTKVELKQAIAYEQKDDKERIADITNELKRVNDKHDTKEAIKAIKAQLTLLEEAAR